MLAVINESDQGKYQRLLLAIQQKSTARTRNSKEISSTVESHHEGLGGEVVELRVQRKKPPTSPSEF